MIYTAKRMVGKNTIVFLPNRLRFSQKKPNNFYRKNELYRWGLNMTRSSHNSIPVYDQSNKSSRPGYSLMQ